MPVQVVLFVLICESLGKLNVWRDSLRNGARQTRKDTIMSRNGLYMVIAVLVVAVAVLAIAYMRESNQPSQISIGAGENGISIEVD